MLHGHGRSTGRVLYLTFYFVGNSKFTSTVTPGFTSICFLTIVQYAVKVLERDGLRSDEGPCMLLELKLAVRNSWLTTDCRSFIQAQSWELTAES